MHGREKQPEPSIFLVNFRPKTISDPLARMMNLEREAIYLREIQFVDVKVSLCCRFLGSV